MKTQSRKVLSVLLALLMVLSSLSVLSFNAFAEGEGEGQGEGETSGEPEVTVGTDLLAAHLDETNIGKDAGTLNVGNSEIYDTALDSAFNIKIGAIWSETNKKLSFVMRTYPEYINSVNIDLFNGQKIAFAKKSTTECDLITEIEGAAYTFKLLSASNENSMILCKIDIPMSALTICMDSTGLYYANMKVDVNTDKGDYDFNGKVAFYGAELYSGGSNPAFNGPNVGWTLTDGINVKNLTDTDTTKTVNRTVGNALHNNVTNVATRHPYVNNTAKLEGSFYYSQTITISSMPAVATVDDAKFLVDGGAVEGCVPQYRMFILGNTEGSTKGTGLLMGLINVKDEGLYLCVSNKYAVITKFKTGMKVGETFNLAVRWNVGEKADFYINNTYLGTVANVERATTCTGAYGFVQDTLRGVALGEGESIKVSFVNVNMAKVAENVVTLETKTAEKEQTVLATNQVITLDGALDEGTTVHTPIISDATKMGAAWDKTENKLYVLLNSETAISYVKMTVGKLAFTANFAGNKAVTNNAAVTGAISNDGKTVELALDIAKLEVKNVNDKATSVFDLEVATTAGILKTTGSIIYTGEVLKISKFGTQKMKLNTNGGDTATYNAAEGTLNFKNSQTTHQTQIFVIQEATYMDLFMGDEFGDFHVSYTMDVQALPEVDAADVYMKTGNSDAESTPAIRTLITRYGTAAAGYAIFCEVVNVSGVGLCIASYTFSKTTEVAPVEIKPLNKQVGDKFVLDFDWSVNKVDGNKDTCDVYCDGVLVYEDMQIGNNHAMGKEPAWIRFDSIHGALEDGQSFDVTIADFNIGSAYPIDTAALVAASATRPAVKIDLADKNETIDGTITDSTIALDHTIGAATYGLYWNNTAKTLQMALKDCTEKTITLTVGSKTFEFNLEEKTAPEGCTIAVVENCVEIAIPVSGMVLSYNETEEAIATTVKLTIGALDDEGKLYFECADRATLEALADLSSIEVTLPEEETTTEEQTTEPKADETTEPKSEDQTTEPKAEEESTTAPADDTKSSGCFGSISSASACVLALVMTIGCVALRKKED